MIDDSQYITHLENLITQKLLPVYNKYYSLLGQPTPILDIPTELKMKSKVASLFLPKKK